MFSVQLLGKQPMPTCTVYFDGDCPVCRAEIAHYQRQRGADAIAWVDASSCDEAALGQGVDRAVVLSRFHVRGADGSLTSGAAAFVEIWRRLPAFAELWRRGDIFCGRWGSLPRRVPTTRRVTA